MSVVVDERDRLDERGLVLGVGDVVVLEHVAEHVALALARELMLRCGAYFVGDATSPASIAASAT